MNHAAFAPALLLIFAAAPFVPVQDGAAKATKEEFERRFASLKKDDAKGFLELGNWAEKAGLAAEAKKAFRAVLDVDANNETARAKLGFVKVGGEWVTKEKAAELEKNKGGDPKKKGAKPSGPSVPGGGIDKDIASNAASDAEEAKRLAKVLGDVPVVVSSAHFSFRGAISKEQGKDALATAEQAYAELNAIFERGADEQIFNVRKLCIYVAKDEAGCRELIPYIEDAHGKIDPYLREDILKNGGGMAANGQHPISLTRSDVELKTYALHQLGQVYIDCLSGSADPWLHEGFAMYTAVRWGGKNTTYCVNVSSYAGNVGGVKKGEDTAYALLCKEIAQDKSDTPIEGLSKKKLNQLDDKDLAKCFSLVKMMVEREPEKGLPFLRLYSSQNVARVLKASYKMPPAEFDDHWRQLQK